MKTQLELPVLANCTYEIKPMPTEHVARCRTIQEAYRMCVNHSIVYRTRDTWGELLGMKGGSFTSILNADMSDRPRYAPDGFIKKLTRLSGNDCIYQWIALDKHDQLYHQRSKDAEVEELEARLAELRKTA